MTVAGDQQWNGEEQCCNAIAAANAARGNCSFLGDHEPGVRRSTRMRMDLKNL